MSLSGRRRKHMQRSMARISRIRIMMLPKTMVMISVVRVREAVESRAASCVARVALGIMVMGVVAVRVIEVVVEKVVLEVVEKVEVVEFRIVRIDVRITTMGGGNGGNDVALNGAGGGGGIPPVAVVDNDIHEQLARCPLLSSGWNQVSIASRWNSSKNVFIKNVCPAPKECI